MKYTLFLPLFIPFYSFISSFLSIFCLYRPSSFHFPSLFLCPYVLILISFSLFPWFSLLFLISISLHSLLPFSLYFASLSLTSELLTHSEPRPRPTQQYDEQHLVRRTPSTASHPVRRHTSRGALPGRC